MDNLITKPVSIQKISLYHYKIPLKARVFIRGISFDVKEGLLIQMVDDNDNESWGEISLLPPTQEKIQGCIRWIEENYAYLLGNVVSFLHRLPSEIQFAVVTAIENFSQIDSNNCGITVKTNALLTGGFEVIIEEAIEKQALGYSIFKIKSGEFSVNETVHLINRLGNIIGFDAQIVLDLNRQWELQHVLALARQISDKNILYIEDPVKHLDELSDYLKISPIKAGIDEFLEDWNNQLESIYRDFPEKIISVIKPSILYGSRAWQKIVNNASCPRVFTSAWETSVGLRGILQIISRYKINVEFVGLDTYSFLTYDIAEPTLPILSPQISSAICNEKWTVIKEKVALLNSWKIS